MEIIEVVRSFIGRFLGNTEFTNEDNIFEKGLVNSLFAMQLVVFIESNYEIELDNDDISTENFKNVDSIVALINSKL